MNYIVFDLEWNQCYGGQEFVNPRMPSEIIEIGAVKLDEKLNIIDRYESYVKPRLYRKLQPHIKAIMMKKPYGTGVPSMWCAGNF